MKCIHLRMAYVFLLLVPLQVDFLAASTARIVGRRLVTALATAPLAMSGMDYGADRRGVGFKNPATDAFGQTRLTKAALNGDCREFQAILKTSANEINMPDCFGLTPLMTAVISRKSGVIYTLLSSNPQLDIINVHGNTALMLAVEAKNTLAVQMLIDAGTDLSVRNSAGLTALGIAKRAGNVYLQQMLIAAGAPE